MLLNHHGRMPTHLLQPGAELLRIAHGGRQGDERHTFGEVDDHLLPDRPAKPIGEVMHFVHDHVPQTMQRL